ncbi:hypothetical protein KDU71_06605 [Carboxylicivirga sediminis]|uniref:Uncharacterized protein n=1 Tax=Carboxylicivirga sediminis TaxID=2006564 RepID=A0A941F336_9BACT|nr:hypothetical protein [Carboxylicivirga sediminis]MBR8535223.1 hypothetical protein [Carboxylicivirga sediminis]
MRDKKEITDEEIKKLIKRREEENAALHKLLKKVTELKSYKSKSSKITN